MRKAFSMMMAVFVMIMMMSITILVFNLSAKITTATLTQYQKEQAILLAKSYTEYAIMAAGANNPREGNCLESITGDVGNIILGVANNGDVDGGQGYRVNVNIGYIGNGLTCNDEHILSDDGVIVTQENGNELSPNIIVDVYVRYRAVNAHQNGKTLPPWVTYHRRTIQKL
ncbi:hypothetical protein MNB_SV-15-1382 [hydrothermal vent metagenome]|uniref:Type 4 fimbrial biogenesis protein PilX N-terminal domain-containing protein n=1 Tax=hydrothermal vent metagenome TaxID=652676 RepID=A0A1W1EI22_9ZZZZ